MKTRTITKTMTIAATLVMLFAFLSAPALADDVAMGANGLANVPTYDRSYGCSANSK